MRVWSSITVFLTVMAIFWHECTVSQSFQQVSRNLDYRDGSDIEGQDYGYGGVGGGETGYGGVGGDIGYKERDVWEFHKFQHYGYKTPKPKFNKLKSLVAFLAPLATLPILGGLALAGLGGTLIPTVTVNAGTAGAAAGRRRRREAVMEVLESQDGNKSFTLTNFSNTNTLYQLHELDVIQKYLQKVRPDVNYDDDVRATYLRCSGMLDTKNGCLELLVCHFSDPVGSMKEHERDMASLIIYGLLKNKFIEESFKSRLRKAASNSRNYPGSCDGYTCNSQNSMLTTSYRPKKDISPNNE
ncbi:uncharacterized protein LOC143235433 [Tachypleus tridentatus]|uniref:uncharacterized protein LOC143235433 n=1 Tax=Tachypleus tridentatus TaxID=6853 RepID=UPI003FD62733